MFVIRYISRKRKFQRNTRRHFSAYTWKSARTRTKAVGCVLYSMVTVWWSKWGVIQRLDGQFVYREKTRMFMIQYQLKQKKKMRSGKKNPDFQRLGITGCASIINKTTPEKQTVSSRHLSVHTFSPMSPWEWVTASFQDLATVFQLLHYETCLLIETPLQHRGWQEVP